MSNSISSSDNIFRTALSGIQEGFRNLNKQAKAIGRGKDPIEPLLESKRSAQQIQANATVIKAAQELDDTLLDILA